MVKTPITPILGHNLFEKTCFLKCSRTFFIAKSRQISIRCVSRLDRKFISRFFLKKSLNNIIFFFISAEPLPLMDLCRRVIRQTINKERIEQGKIAELNLPKTIKDYLEYKDRRALHSVVTDVS